MGELLELLELLELEEGDEIEALGDEELTVNCPKWAGLLGIGPPLFSILLAAKKGIIAGLNKAASA